MTSPTIDTSESKRGGKFLTFFISDEEYGLEILKVQEIIGIMDITPLPGTPDFIRGIINLRGKVIPVVELRQKFNMNTIESTKETCIIVVKVDEIEIGVVVDQVSEVRDIADVDIEDAPAFGTNIDTHYILGVGKTVDRVQLLLDIDEVLDHGVVDQLAAKVEAQEPLVAA